MLSGRLILLSQFPGEDEVLFPPCTMLHVIEKKEERGRSRAEDPSRRKDALGERGSRYGGERVSGWGALTTRGGLMKAAELAKGAKQKRSFHGNDQAEKLANEFQEHHEEDGKEYMQIHVLPTFI